MGNARLLTIQAGGTSVQIETQHQIVLLPGATVHLTLPSEKLHIFPK
jgi:hypothetical protein